MLDSNVFDRLADDEESLCELENRRDIRVLVSSVQRQELAAVPDDDRRLALLGILERLAGSLKADESDCTADSRIYDTAAAHCDILVSDDIHMHALAMQAALKPKAIQPRGKQLRVMDYNSFRDQVLWSSRRGR
ncbi:MAG TPA: hypothetical protein PLC54_04245 [Spirochaetales bacterium]|nr:hypothetical protein [Spirochaetales bacterium]